ncbi:MAG: hypothetical protein R3B38_01345 [Patescibacteria group bacterium]
MVISVGDGNPSALFHIYSKVRDGKELSPEEKELLTIIDPKTYRKRMLSADELYSMLMSDSGIGAYNPRYDGMR